MARELSATGGLSNRAISVHRVFVRRPLFSASVGVDIIQPMSRSARALPSPGTGVVMSESQPEPGPSMAGVANETAEESVEREEEVVGDSPDTGGLVPEDSAQ